MQTTGKKGANYKIGNNCGKCGDSRKYKSGACVGCAIEKRKINYSKNKDKESKAAAERYKEKTKDKPKRKKQTDEQKKEYNRNYYSSYWKNNPVQKIARNTLARMFSDWKGGRNKCEIALGYSFDSLKSRLEFQFKDGMSWDNYGEWHVDHKKPISRFIEQGVSDPAIINALSNLQPLWAKENLSKGAKWNV